MIQADIFAEDYGLFLPVQAGRGGTWHIGRWAVSGVPGDEGSLCGRIKASASWVLDLRHAPTPETTCQVCQGVKDGTWKR